MNIIAWSAVAGLVVGIAVFFWQQIYSKTLSRELAALRASEAVSEGRLKELERERSAQTQRLETLGAQHQTLALERERCDTLLGQARLQLEEANTWLKDSLQKLRVAETDGGRVSADLQIATAKLESSTAGEKQLRADYERNEQERQSLSRKVTQVQASFAALQQECDGLREQLVSQRAWVAEQTKQFEQSVLAAAAKLMEERGRAFTETNKREVDAVVAPFKEQLQEFRQRVDAIYAADTSERGQLREQILQLTSLNQAVSAQAERLTNALTISSKSTGDWGETILERILENSGLREGHEYELQHSIRGPEGDRVQPDAVIFLPENRQVVVDSKVSNKAWNDYCNETDGARRETRLWDHIASLRAHVKGLSGKDYARSPDLRTVEFVLMFVPVEAALLTALAKDDTLYSEAYRSKIILVTPSTLMAVVKLVEGIWTFQKRKESADEIAEAGRKLYEKLTSFASTFLDVGVAISKAKDSFEKAQKQLATGNGNAIKLAQQMLQLGVTPAAGKVMPAALLQLDPESEVDVTRLSV